MQISTDFSTSTLVAIAVTALSLTCVLTTLILFKTYGHEIEQLYRRLVNYARHLILPNYIERPGGVFVANPRLYPVRTHSTIPYHYVASAFREWEGPTTFPPLFESQSTGLSTSTNEQDVGQEGGRVLYEEYKTISTISDPVLPEEEVQYVSTPRLSITIPSSPEFPFQEPGIPVIIRSDTPTDSYVPHSPTTSKIIIWNDNQQNVRECTPTPHPYTRAWSPNSSDFPGDSGTRSVTPQPASDIRRAATASRDAAAREELARLISRNNEIERTITRDRTATQFYERASRPQLESETTTQYWQRQSATPAETSAINEIEEETYRQRPRPITPIWLDRYRQYRSHQMEQGLPGVSIATWMEYRARAGDRDPRRAGTRVQEYMAFQASAYTDRSDLDAFGGSTDVQAVSLFNKLHPFTPYRTPAPYQSRSTKEPPLVRSHEPRRRRHPISPQIHHQTNYMYSGPGQVQAGSGGAEAGGSGNKPDIDVVDSKSDDGWGGGNEGKKPEKPAEPWKPGTGFFKGEKPPDEKDPFNDSVAKDKERWSLPGAPDKFDPDTEPPNPIEAMGDDAPWIGCKPDLIRKPEPFRGEPEDIDRFLTDCQMYFQVHSAYMWLDPHRVAFASSYFEGKAKDWWTLQLADLYSSSRGKYRFPSWYAFKQAVETKFSDPGHQDKHKAAMYALRMTGTMTATEYFQELETLAKKAKLRHDTDDRGHMVTALRQGVPASYTNMIANIGTNIPIGYEQWGRRIIIMNEERLRKQALDLVGRMLQPRPPAPQQNAGTPKGASGTTTSSATKKTATGTTYGGRGQPMDIDAIKSGNCFRCGEKGHISKNCSLQSWNKGKKQEVRASTTEPSTGSKIEEVKDVAGNHSGRTYTLPVVNISHPPHSILFAERNSNQTCKESHNRYAILTTDGDTHLSSVSDDEAPRGAESPNTTDPALRNSGAKRHTSSLHGATQPTKVLDEKSPTIVTPIDTASQPRRTDGTWAKLKYAPCEVSSDEQAAPTERSPIATIDVESRSDGAQENTARSPKDTKAIPQEVASAQAIKRGHSVVMIEIPDEEDDTSFIRQQNKVAATNADTCGPSPKRKSPLMEKEAEHPIGNDTSVSKGREAAKHAPPTVAPQEWLKPFETEWTWRAIKDAKDESSARAILLNWIHKTRVEEVVDNLLEGLRSSEHFRALEWLDELRKPKRYFIRAQNSPQSLLIPVELETLEHPITIQAKALLNSGCTGSSIHRNVVKKYGIPVQKTASPIPVYNADGSRNKAGEITTYAELRLKIRGHSERIDLAITDLGSKEIFLGHDWLVRHNPSINWATGSVTFTRCQCAGNRFVLPDADPDDEWELEEGETILAVDFEEAIEIRAVHKANELAAKANEEKEKKTFEQMVPESYRDFKDLFSKENFDDLPVRKPWDHAIELVPNAKNTLDCKVYPLNPIEQKELDKFLDENLASGRIKPSKSPMASPFFFVKKKDGTLHPVQDYRKLNEMTIKNRYPLPLISELMDKLGSAKYFTKLDVRWGYNNVRIRKDDEWKAAFRTNRGLFEPTVMFFGLTNSPATFQWMMNDIFKDLIATGKITVYLDDILIFSKTLEEHRKITHRVLALLRKHKLFLKAEKCEFEVLETKYLGVIISEGSIRMDPIKLAGIAEWPAPTKKKELQSFLGFANFYRRFIKGYSDIVRPMTCLTGKEAWTWGTAQQLAFQQLKNRFAIDVILRIPTEKGQFRVEADASEGAIGAVLSQEQDGKWRPVAFLSKALTITERNYEIYDKELLAIMLALDEWRHYLMGAAVDFEIWTDHQNLQYFRKPQKLNRRQARWVTELAEYHFTLHHKPGASNKKADLLSRRADHPQGQDDNDEITVLSPEHFRTMIMPTTNETHEHIKSATRSHQKWDQGIANSLNHEKGIKERDGLLYYDQRIYVPRDSATRGEVISRCHDHITAGHPGIEKTKELILRDYWWPKLKKDVETYVRGCETCTRTKASTQARRAPLHPNEIPSEPWTHISVDMITGLVPCKGLDAILVIVDCFSKAIIPIACKTTLSSEGWAKILRDEVYAKYGMPVTVISDRGPQFVSKFLQDLYKMLDIKGNASTAYHPQTDGQTEHINQEIEKYLRIFINVRQTDWPEWLPLAAFQHNNRIHSATGKSPFFVNFGRNPRIAPDTHTHAALRTPASEEFQATMKLIHDETRAALTKAAEQMKTQYDKKKKTAITYQPGDKVWLDTTNLHLARPKKKLDDKHIGPFTILEKRGLSAYKLKLPLTWKIYPVFNETLLNPYIAPTFSNQQQDPPPPPDIINDEPEYEVEAIINHKTRKVRGQKDKETGKYTTNTVTDYLVKWKGYGREEDKWTKESELDHAKEAIADYQKTIQGTVTVQAVVVKSNNLDPPTFILNSRMKDGNVQFQVQKGSDFVTTAWYFEHEIPHLSELIKDYYWVSRDEFGEEYGPIDGYTPEGEGG
ncbi:uncharacterized protein ARMOST_12191 [Armillaria ostoyae]|uniref:RNA-directed DNA polymerase n=1 Tax=Armillaria ostoyae TaxID=47428 RepID=A0A284RJ92_ARMOS|nr:uncharacterized protein ARMOST_12191 [Armillaria ostoyae]